MGKLRARRALAQLDKRSTHSSRGWAQAHQNSHHPGTCASDDDPAKQAGHQRLGLLPASSRSRVSPHREHVLYRFPHTPTYNIGIGNIILIDM